MSRNENNVSVFLETIKVFLPLLIVECGISETLCSREKSVCFGYFIPPKTHQKFSLQRGHEGKQKWRLKGGKREEKNKLELSGLSPWKKKKTIRFFFFFALLLFNFFVLISIFVYKWVT